MMYTQIIPVSLSWFPPAFPGVPGVPTSAQLLDSSLQWFYQFLCKSENVLAKKLN